MNTSPETTPREAFIRREHATVVAFEKGTSPAWGNHCVGRTRSTLGTPPGDGPTTLTYRCDCGHTVSGHWSPKLCGEFFDHTVSCKAGSGS